MSQGYFFIVTTANLLIDFLNFFLLFSVNLRDNDKVNLKDFDILKVLGTGGKFFFLCFLEEGMEFDGFISFEAYGKVFLVRKNNGADKGQLYAMKVIKKAAIIQKKKTAEHTRTERQVSGKILVEISIHECQSSVKVKIYSANVPLLV